MKSIFDLDLISELFEKLEAGTISNLEHDYLQKIISALIIIQLHNKIIHKKSLFIIKKYYKHLCSKFKSKLLSPKIKTDYFLLLTEIENFFAKFRIAPSILKFEHISNDERKKQSTFQKFQQIALFWDINLTQDPNSIFDFMSFFLHVMYDIPNSYIRNIQNLLTAPWKPVLSPLGVSIGKKLNFEKIEEYFFGRTDCKFFNVHVLPNSDRLFSMTSPVFDNHLFLAKENDFDIYEASQVVHEFQHIQDSKEHPNKLKSLFELEKNAINAERIFLQAMGTSKKGKFNWVESNLLYPILILKWEYELMISKKEFYDIQSFQNICHTHGMEPLSLSFLFETSSPFQMSAYCAAAMEVEQNWQTYLRDIQV